MTNTARMLLNGAEPSAVDLQSFVLSNYSHFTSLQYRDGAVPGLSLHLARLAQSTRELFGCELPAARVRAELKAALAGCDAAMVRINVYLRALSLRELAPGGPPDLLISVLPPAPPPAPPLRVCSAAHARYLPQVKHAGTFNLFHQRREARRRGYDDVLFAADDGRISEGSVWNVGFWDGAQLVWPEAPALLGVTQQLLTPLLVQQGIAVRNAAVRVEELARFRYAFFTNAAVAVQPLAAVDGVVFSGDAAFEQQLQRCWAAVPWEAL